MVALQIIPLAGDPIVMGAARRLFLRVAPGQAGAADADIMSGLADMWRGLAQQASTFLASINYLEFDGAELCWIGPANRGRCWPAVSGRSGYQSPDQQSLRNYGPIPDGLWYVRQSEYQTMPDFNLIQTIISELGRGTWPGGESSWGRQRIWLHPFDHDEVYGRSGFSIHGGDEPGSAGCVDLTSSMADFANTFTQYGRDMLLIVRYRN